MFDFDSDLDVFEGVDAMIRIIAATVRRQRRVDGRVRRNFNHRLLFLRRAHLLTRERKFQVIGWIQYFLFNIVTQQQHDNSDKWNKGLVPSVLAIELILINFCSCLIIMII